MRRLVLHSILLVGFATFANAQERTISFSELTEIMQKANAIYLQNEYSVGLEVYTYKGHFSVYPEDQSKGYIHKKNGITEQYINKIYSLQNNSVKLMVDSIDNVIGVTFPDTASFSFTPNSVFIEKYNKYVKNIKHVTYENGKQLITINYIDGMPYEKIDITLNKTFAEEVIFYYADARRYEAKDGRTLEEKPKLRVKLSKKGTSTHKYKMSDLAQKKGNTYELGRLFNGFQLIDFRYRN